MIPVTSDRIPEGTIYSVLQQACRCFEIIILQNDVSSMPEKTDVIEAKLPLPYAELPIQKLQIRKKGKGHALNVGIRNARYEFICVIDADCILEDGALSVAMQHFEDENVSAVGGRLKARSKKKNLLTFCQRIEYMKAFNISRPLWNALNANCLISGAYGIFRKSDIDAVYGYDEDTVGEDMELVLSMQARAGKEGKRICYEASSVCSTSVPTTIYRLFRQRERWQRGLLDCILKYRWMILNPHYGILGLVAMPYQVLVELLGPVFILLQVVNLICFTNTVPQMLKLYLLYMGFELSLACIAEYLEYVRWKAVIMKLPEAIVATVLGVILSVPLAVVRLLGMISFSWRRLEW